MFTYEVHDASFQPEHVPDRKMRFLVRILAGRKILARHQSISRSMVIENEAMLLPI